MAAKKHKLSVAIGEDYGLLGIVSDEPDYKLCWMINQRINTSFTRDEDLVLFSRTLNQEQEIPLFQSYDDHKMLTLRLIRNRLTAGYFLADLKHIDYVLHIQGEITPEDLNDMIREINSTPSVRMCVPVDLKRIREHDRLNLW